MWVMGADRMDDEALRLVVLDRMERRAAWRRRLSRAGRSSAAEEPTPARVGSVFGYGPVLAPMTTKTPVASPVPPTTAASPAPNQPHREVHMQQDVADPEPDTAPAVEAPPYGTPPQAQRPRRKDRKRHRRTRAQRRAEQAPLTTTVPLDEILGNATLSKDGIVVWYRMPSFRWAYTTDARREAMLAGIARAVAGLAGRRLHLRVTHAPVDIAAWAHDLDRSASPENLEAWREQLDRTQASLAGAQLSEKLVYIGVHIADRRSVDRIVAKARKEEPAERELLRLTEVRDSVTQAMTAPGLDAFEATHAEVVGLVHRSLGLHLPYDGDVYGDEVAPEDMAAFTDGVDITPWDSQLVKVTARPSRTDSPECLTRYVAILSIGRMEDLHVPEGDSPWLAMAAELGFPVEVSAHLDVLGGEDARRAVEGRLKIIREQQREEDEFDLDADPEWEVIRQQAIDTRHELSAGDPVAATRVHGQYRLAVYGNTPEQAHQRARQLITHYRSAQIAIERPRGPVALLGEFVPGAPRASTAHTRRGNLSWFAAAVPHLDDHVGDFHGPYLGRTCSYGRPVMWDMWAAMERGESTGLTSLVAEPGAGKSALLGRLAYWSALMGVSTTILDPSGPLAWLCYMPELKDISEHIDLAGAEDGALNPFGLIPLPRRSDYTPEEYLVEAERVRGERLALARDVVKMLLPPSVLRDKRTDFVVADAFADVAANVRDRTPHLGDVLLALDVLAAGGPGREPDEHARHMAIYLRQASQEPLGRLMFADDQTAGSSLDTDKTLVVFTMGGLVMPLPGSDPVTWTDKERFTVPLLHLAAAATIRRVYSQPMNTRKLVEIDECHWLERWGSGAALWNRLSRDSRKWRTRVIAASQIPSDVDSMSALSGESFIGLLTDEAAQEAACRLMRVPPEYAPELGDLSPPMDDGRSRDYREFWFRDYRKRVGLIAVRLDDSPNLAIALGPGPKPWPGPQQRQRHVQAVREPARPAATEGVA
jgi:hypothetical protein